MSTGEQPPIAAMQVPPQVVKAVQTRWPKFAPTWCELVLDELAELCDRYQATSPRVLPARYGLVVAVTTPGGLLVMRSSPDPAGPVQAEVSKALAELGIAPTIHEVAITAASTWTVMEQILPGTPVDRGSLAGPRLDALARTLEAMTGQPAPACGLPTIVEWLHERLTSENLVDLAPSHRRLPPANLRKEALATLQDLRSSHATDQLCHGDTSLGNILIGSDQLFLVDPRGVSGEVEYDAAVLAIKAAHPDPPMSLAADLAARAGLDTDRVRAWVTAAVAACV